MGLPKHEFLDVDKCVYFGCFGGVGESAHSRRLELRRQHVKGGGLSEGMREEDLFVDP